MKISVVIPAVNECEHIARTIHSAWRAGFDQVIVCDGGSTDGTVEAVLSTNATLVRSELGRAEQLNRGVSACSGDVILFLHADNWFEVPAGDQIRDVFQDARVLFGAFRQQIDATGWGYRALEWGNEQRVRRCGMPYGDQGIVVRRSALQRVGGVPTVPLMEDYILVRQLKRLARPVIMPGPIKISARRWQQHGVIRQTLRNWALVAAFNLGVSTERLARHYRRHDVS